MIIKPKDFDESLQLVFDVLNQGDSRYNAPEAEIILANFLLTEAIILEEKEILPIKFSKEDEETISFLYNLQWAEKRLAKELLKTEGFKDNEIYFERAFLNSRPDVLAESANKLILVECCSCRINKIIDFLSEADEVWVITKGEDPNEKIHYSDGKMQWFIFKKGDKWQEVFSNFQKQKYEELKKIQSPLDRL